MKAIDITGNPPSGKRTPISQLVPLDTPLLIQIFPIYVCNFKCKYCMMSIPQNERHFVTDRSSMELSLFQKCIRDIEQFPQKVKVLRFVGMGEPLLHKDLSDMIYCAATSGKFERIEVLTNGSLLTPKLSQELISAGLTKLLISIQGTSAEKYKEISNINIDFNKFLENIWYFYHNRKQCKVHIKIADCALDNEEDKNRFFNIFGDICDTIGIEIIGPIHDGVKFNEQLSHNSINQYGIKKCDINICSQPFYHMQINPDGNVVPCYSLEYPIILGNCYTQSIVDIWNSKIYNEFRLKILEGVKNINICRECKIFQHRAYDSDNLSTETDRLKEIYK
jgi:radical SAM protein with 4Fe4S-binding SPASM domain